MQDLPENLLAAVLEGNDTLNIILFKWEVARHSLSLPFSRRPTLRESRKSWRACLCIGHQAAMLRIVTPGRLVGLKVGLWC